MTELSLSFGYQNAVKQRGGRINWVEVGRGSTVTDQGLNSLSAKLPKHRELSNDSEFLIISKTEFSFSTRLPNLVRFSAIKLTTFIQTVFSYRHFRNPQSLPFQLVTAIKKKLLLKLTIQYSFSLQIL